MLIIKKETLPKSKIKLTVSVPPELMRGFFSTIYSKLAPSVSVKGFRPGKAPKNLTIMQIGENRFNSEIIDLALQESYGQALKQEKIIPVAPPKVEIKKMVDLTADNAEMEYEVEVDVLPEVKVGDYRKIRIKNKEVSIKVGKDEIDQVLSHLQRQHATFNDIERAAKTGDRVEMDFEGTERGVVLENLTSKNYPVILGSKVLMPEFEKKVEGMKAGEEKEFEIELKQPHSGHDHNHDHDHDHDHEIKIDKTHKVHFKVKMNMVQEVILPELNDELAKKFGQTSMADLQKIIEADILNQKKLAVKQNKENEVIEELLKITTLEVPESLISQEVDRMFKQLQTRTSEMGLPFDKYLEGLHKTEEELKSDMTVQAEKTVKVGLALGEVGKLEKLDLSQEKSGQQVIEKLLEYAGK